MLSFYLIYAPRVDFNCSYNVLVFIRKHPVINEELPVMTKITNIEAGSIVVQCKPSTVTKCQYKNTPPKRIASVTEISESLTNQNTN